MTGEASEHLGTVHVLHDNLFHNLLRAAVLNFFTAIRVLHRETGIITVSVMNDRSMQLRFIKRMTQIETTGRIDSLTTHNSIPLIAKKFQALFFDSVASVFVHLFY
jgi:hypothetical protein